MSRLTKKEYYLEIAGVVAKRSTCLKRNYGAVIVKDDRIISTGYNGAPRGRANCMEDIKKCPRMNVAHNTDYSTCRSVHAEANAIIHASYNDTQGSVLYLTGWDAQTGERLPVAEPCPMCKRMIINAQIEKVISWDDEHHSVKEYFVKDWTLPCNDDSIPKIDGSEKIKESIKDEEGIPHLKEFVADLRSRLEQIKFEYSDEKDYEEIIKKRFKEAMSEFYKDIIENGSGKIKESITGKEGIPHLKEAVFDLRSQEPEYHSHFNTEEIPHYLKALVDRMQIGLSGDHPKIEEIQNKFNDVFSSQNYYETQNYDRMILINATIAFFQREFLNTQLWTNVKIFIDNPRLREKILCFAVQGMAQHGQPHTWNVDKAENFQRMMNNQNNHLNKSWEVKAVLCHTLHSPRNYFVELTISNKSNTDNVMLRMDDNTYTKLLPTIRLMKILDHSPSALQLQLYGCCTVMENLERMKQTLKASVKEPKSVKYKENPDPYRKIFDSRHVSLEEISTSELQEACVVLLETWVPEYLMDKSVVWVDYCVSRDQRVDLLKDELRMIVSAHRYVYLVDQIHAKHHYSLTEIDQLIKSQVAHDESYFPEMSESDKEFLTKAMRDYLHTSNQDETLYDKCKQIACPSQIKTLENGWSVRNGVMYEKIALNKEQYNITSELLQGVVDYDIHHHWTMKDFVRFVLIGYHERMMKNDK